MRFFAWRIRMTIKMKNKLPIVSIVMPTYNSSDALLAKSIESARGQTFPDWELIIVDDASTNDTPRLLDSFAQKDQRIRVVHKEKNEFRELGISGSLNRGIDLARGKYIARLDQDDYWIDSRKLEKQVAYLDAHPNCVVVGGGVVVVDGEGNERFRYFKKETDAEIRTTALFANPFSHTTVLFRKDIAVGVGNYRGKHIEDWDLWLRMGERGTFYNFQEYFMAYTMTGTNASFVNQRALSRNVLKLLGRERKNYPGFPKAYALNLMQYIYALLPLPAVFRARFHVFLLRLKRRAF
jgi:glycosyltransferase involved in cell wall biosynthesis